MKDKITALSVSLILIFAVCGCTVNTTTSKIKTSSASAASVNTSSVTSEDTATSSAENSSQEASVEQERKILSELQNNESSSSSASSASSSSSAAIKPSQTKPQAKAPSPSPSVVRSPKVSGKKVLSGSGAVIDVSNSSQGYLMAKCSGCSKRLKLQIKTSKMTYNYDLNNKGSYEVFPLQMGNGSYTVRVMKNVSGSSYSQLFADDFSVSLESNLLPYLYPNQYVNFSSSSAAVKKASNLCAGCSTDIEKLKAIYNFMTDEISYDYAKAKSVKSTYLPDVDSVLASKKGICFDYSSLMAAMLRSQNIPTQLVIGSAGAVAQNHAWNEVYIRGTGWITIKIKNNGTGWKLLDPTFGEKAGSASSYAAARVY